MKKLNFILILLLIVSFYSCSQKEPEQEAEKEEAKKSGEIFYAILTSRKGDVKVKQNNKWRKAYKGHGLRKGDVIRTGAKSTAFVRFRTGSKTIIRKNSVLELEEIKKNLKLKMKTGSVFMKVSKLTKGQSFEVETPTMIAGVRGTEWYAQVDEHNRSLVGVYEGKVAVESEGKKVEVNEGQGTIAEKGKPPLVPFPLPEKPVIDDITVFD